MGANKYLQDPDQEWHVQAAAILKEETWQSGGKEVSGEGLGVWERGVLKIRVGGMLK